MEKSGLSLSVVVPVHNDEAGLVRLLRSLVPLEAFLHEVIAVDDSSDPPLARSTARLPRPSGVPLRIVATGKVSGDTPRGAGYARNSGAAIASGSHLLFLDADDSVQPPLVELLNDLDGTDFDFTIFCHDDSRRLQRGETGPDEALDRALWRDIAPGPMPRPLDIKDAAAMCRASSYPWNRIWRRNFLIAEKIRATEIPLHNDIEPHWAGYLTATKILVSDRHCLRHEVAPANDQLSNRRDADRLRLFEALEAVSDRLACECTRDPARLCFAGPFLDFVLRLADWVETMMPDAVAMNSLRTRLRAFLARLAAMPDPLAQAFECALDDEPGVAETLLRLLGNNIGETPCG